MALAFNSVKDRLELWTVAAQMLGFNQLAKEQKTLGQKLFCRIALNVARKRFFELGGQCNITDPETVLVLDDHVPHIELKTTDIELMRKFLADYDKEHAAEITP